MIAIRIFLVKVVKPWRSKPKSHGWMSLTSWLHSLVALVDVPGEIRPVVVALHLNEAVGHFEMTRIASIHPRSLSSHVTNWMTDDLTRYINKRSAEAWFQSRELQLPKEGTAHQRKIRTLQHKDVFKSCETGFAEVAPKLRAARIPI